MKKIVSLFHLSQVTPSPQPARSQPKVKIGDKVGNVTILAQYQLDKHTDFKVGESYRVGEMIVTLRASKAEVARIIAQVDAAREAKIARLTKRAEDIMLMSPKELEAFQLEEWLAKRKEVHNKIKVKIGELSANRYSPPIEEVPSGSKLERFKKLMKNVITKDKVH